MSVRIATCGMEPLNAVLRYSKIERESVGSNVHNFSKVSEIHFSRDGGIPVFSETFKTDQLYFGETDC